MIGKRRVPSREWRLIYAQGLLVLSAGADRLYALEGVSQEVAAEAIRCWEHKELDDEELSAEGRDLLRRLTECGTVDVPAAVAQTSRIALRWAGDCEPALEDRLAELIARSDTLELVLDAPDLVLVIRTTARLADLYPSTECQSTAHLLLDIAYHHTLSLGPLVLPGESACLACLAGRIIHFWGDPEPPLRPAALGAAPLAAALAVYELERIGAGDYGLAGVTVTYDLDSRTTATGVVYRLPWCPVCGDGGETAGIAELPWTSAA